MSWVLREHGIEHIVIERGRIGERWRAERWDSLRLLTPNWATWLPGWLYSGPDPDGFMSRSEFVDHLEAYASAYDTPLRLGVDVRSVEPSAHSEDLVLRTTAGDVAAHNVVLATGPFQEPRLPAVAGELPAGVESLHSSRYRNPECLPPGAVLVVGTGASGQQIADELVSAGRRVFVSVGRNRRVPRRYRGRDHYWWLEHAGFYDKTVDDVPPSQRGAGGSPALTGIRGGTYDLDLRRLAAEGATLLGRVRGIDGQRISFARDLADSLAQGDRGFEQFVTWVEARVTVPGAEVDPPEPVAAFPDPPEVADPLLELDLEAAGIRTVIWSTGYRPTFTSWVHVPVFDQQGASVHRRGVTAHPGLFFLGLHWLYRQRSAFIRGAQEDALHIGQQIAERPRK